MRTPFGMQTPMGTGAHWGFCPFGVLRITRTFFVFFEGARPRFIRKNLAAAAKARLPNAAILLNLAPPSQGEDYSTSASAEVGQVVEVLLEVSLTPQGSPK